MFSDYFEVSCNYVSKTAYFITMFLSCEKIFYVTGNKIMIYEFNDVTPHRFTITFLWASDYFRVSCTAALFVWGYIECSRLETLVSYGFMDIVSGGASELISGAEN